jgi:diacylglycerol kinase (ATP)
MRGRGAQTGCRSRRFGTGISGPPRGVVLGRGSRLVLIANPAAGRGHGLVAAGRAQAVLKAAGCDVRLWATEGPGDATRLARQAAAEGHDAVLACGGDGTLSQVLSGLVETSVPAGVIPAGTGNDFCRTIGLSRDPREAARQLLAACDAPVDMLEVNAGAAWSVNTVGIGFDARVAVRINRRRRLTSGLLAYLSAVAQELAVYRPARVRLEVDSTGWEGQILLVAIANARFYGAGMMIAPMARINDGLLDVVVVTHMGRLEFVRGFPRVLRGDHLEHPAVRS